jgi:hypothetical protein
MGCHTTVLDLRHLCLTSALNYADLIASRHTRLLVSEGAHQMHYLLKDNAQAAAGSLSPNRLVQRLWWKCPCKDAKTVLTCLSGAARSELPAGHAGDGGIHS